MPRWFYTLLLRLLLPLILLRQCWRGRAFASARGHMRQRLGFVEPPPSAPIWLHCVSVGESVAAEPLIEALLADGEVLLVTSTTFTGAERVRGRFGDRLCSRFMPCDTPGAVARFLDRARPRLLVILETELWPNLLAACRMRGIPVMLVNTRLSARSARRYARLGGLVRDMLAVPAAMLAQGKADADRLIALGAPPARVRVSGNLKFDRAPDSGQLSRAEPIRAAIGRRPVWIAASTHEGEEDVVLSAHREILRAFPEALLLLVPRHPERFDTVAGVLARSGFGGIRRSRGELPSAADAVWLIDTMGELNTFYSLAEVAFVGGSLVPAGGHSLVEPASSGLPVLAGPRLFNCQQIADDLVAAGALQIVNGAAAIVVKVSNLLASESLRREAGRAGRDYVAASQGAGARALAAIREKAGRA